MSTYTKATIRLPAVWSQMLDELSNLTAKEREAFHKLEDFETGNTYDTSQQSPIGMSVSEEGEWLAHQRDFLQQEFDNASTALQRHAIEMGLAWRALDIPF